MKCTWTGTDPIGVPTVGDFQPGETKDLTPEQAQVVNGVNDERFVFGPEGEETKETKRGKKKEEEEVTNG